MRWSATENVRWAVDVPGRGWSSPIVWNGRVYVTSAISSKPFKQPTPGLYGNDYIAELKKQGLPDDEVMRRVQARDNEGPEESDVVRYMVYALDAKTGAIIWEREAHKGFYRSGTQTYGMGDSTTCLRNRLSGASWERAGGSTLPSSTRTTTTTPRTPSPCARGAPCGSPASSTP